MNQFEIKKRIQAEMKTAMRDGNKERLGVIRLMLAAVKQIEVDERIEVDDARMLLILDKMVKQRRESVKQYEAAKRDDLVNQERYEIGILQEFLPAALTESEIRSFVEEAIRNQNAQTVRDMGKVMENVKPKVQGRADMNQVSQLVKSMLTS